MKKKYTYIFTFNIAEKFSYGTYSSCEIHYITNEEEISYSVLEDIRNNAKKEASIHFEPNTELTVILLNVFRTLNDTVTDNDTNG